MRWTKAGNATNGKGLNMLFIYGSVFIIIIFFSLSNFIHFYFPLALSLPINLLNFNNREQYFR